MTENMMIDPETEDTDELLSQFTDLVNDHGVESEEVKEFRAVHGEGELGELMDTAVKMRDYFEKVDIGDTPTRSWWDKRMENPRVEWSAVDGGEWTYLVTRMLAFLLVIVVTFGYVGMVVTEWLR